MRDRRSVLISKLSNEIADLKHLLNSTPAYSRQQLEDSGRWLSTINQNTLQISRLRAEIKAEVK